MKCECCKQNEATFFYEENVNGKVRSLHLCPDCAAKMKGEHPFSEGFALPSLDPLSSSLFGGLFGFSQLGKETQKVCPGCNAAWSDLRRAGKAFCPQCYATFGEELSPTLRSLHGNVTHTGRAPADRREKREREDRLATLKKQLATAIAEEKFEDAAKLRDEIRTIEKE